MGPDPKVTIKGVFSTYKTLADGTRRTYWYHRATHARLPGEKGSAEFLAAYLEAEKIPASDIGTVAALIRAYITGRRFTHTKKGRPKATSTQKEYLRLLNAIELRFGTLPIKALESPKVNAIFIDYHEEVAMDRPREADNRMTVFCAVLNEAKRRGQIMRNPLEKFERVYTADRSEMIWTEADIGKFMFGAPVELQRVMILAIHTGQRYGDLIRLRWSDYNGQTIWLIQSKGSKRVAVHCSAALKAMLDATPRQCAFILARADGRPWFTDKDDKALAKAWHARMKESGFYPKPFADLTKEEKKTFLRFHDMRGTAVTLLAEAGVAVPQICAVTGHELGSATHILEKYLARTAAMTKAAIVAFENSPATAFANRLQTTAQAMTTQKSKG